MLLYGSESSAGQWVSSARKLQRAFRVAASMLHARGVDGCVFKAFIAPGWNAQSAVQDEIELNFVDLSVAWRIAMRNVLRSGEVRESFSMACYCHLTSPPTSLTTQESRHMLAASCQRLPRIVLLRQGQLQLWTSAVQHALDFVDVHSTSLTSGLAQG